MNTYGNYGVKMQEVLLCTVRDGKYHCLTGKTCIIGFHFQFSSRATDRTVDQENIRSRYAENVNNSSITVYHQNKLRKLNQMYKYAYRRYRYVQIKSPPSFLRPLNYNQFITSTFAHTCAHTQHAKHNWNSYEHESMLSRPVGRVE